MRKRLDYAIRLRIYHEYYKNTTFGLIGVGILHTYTYGEIVCIGLMKKKKYKMYGEKKTTPDKTCMHIEIDNAGKPRERKLRSRRNNIKHFSRFDYWLSVSFILENV